MATYTLTENDDILGIDPYRYPADDSGPYVVFALGGNDGITGGTYNDTLYGGEGNDSLAGGLGANVVHGDNGDDYIQIYNEADALPNADLLADTVFGDAGDDTVQLILGGASIAHKADGGAGIDTLSISFESRYDTQNQLILYSKLIDLRGMWSGGVGKVDTATVQGFEHIGGISGGAGNDTIIMGNYIAPINPATDRVFDAPLINGNGGDDTIYGGASADQIDGGAGSDTIYGNDGNDTLNAGNFYNSFGNDAIHGGNGDDVINGNGGNDRLYGDAGADTIYASDGKDTLSGGDGNDTLNGGEGNDILYGGAGDDQLQGGGGSNRLNGDAGNDSLFGGDLLDTLKGGAGDDFLAGFGGSDRLFGGAGNDTLQGLNGGDVVRGGDGDDTLDESVQDDAAADKLYGDAGADTLNGGGGNDRLDGGTGTDSLTGGAGRDVFIFANAPDGDTITDFVHSQGDKIQLSRSAFAGLTHNGFLLADEFYSASGASAGHDASDRVIYDPASGKLWFDADGNGAQAAHLIATLAATDHPALVATDILIVA